MGLPAIFILGCGVVFLLRTSYFAYLERRLRLLHETGAALLNSQQNAPAEQHYRAGLAESYPASFEKNAIHVTCRANFGHALWRIQKWEEARATMSGAVRQLSAIAPHSASLPLMLSSLGDMSRDLARYEESITAYQWALEVIAEHPGEQHRHYATRERLGTVYLLAGEYQRAFEHLSWCVAHASTRPEDAARVAIARVNLGVYFSRRGEFEEAERLFHEVIAEGAPAADQEQRFDLLATANLAGVRYWQQRIEEAEQFAREACADVPGNRARSAAFATRATIAIDQSRFEEAEKFLTLGEEFRRPLPDENPRVAAARRNRAELRIAQGRLDEADTLLRDALAALEAKLRPDHLSIAYTRFEIGRVRSRQGRVEEARAAFVAAHAAFAKNAPAHRRTIECRRALEELPA